MNTEIAVKIISRMQFSAADYVRNREQIINEAAKLYSRQTGEESAETKAELSVLLERSFAERKVLSIDAAELPDHLRDRSVFRIFLDDTVVTGSIRLSPKTITVEITSPFQGRMAGAELDMLAPIIWTEQPEVGSEANEEGRQKSILLLADIYYSLLQ